MSRSAGERGLAAPVVVTLAGLLVVLTLVAAAMGRLLVDQRRVAAAADLAALAGATSAQQGGSPCAAARGMAEANSGRLVGCRVQGERVRVASEVASPTLLGRVVRLRATAVAGPVR